MKMNIDTVVSELKIDRSNWSLTTFGDVAIQQKQSVDRENTDITCYVKGEHMRSEDIHLKEWGELKDEYLGPAFIRKFEEGDILYGSRRTYLRKVCIAPFEGITSNTTFVIKAKEEFIDKRLLPFLMLSEGFSEQSIQNSKGSVNPYVNWKDLANYEFLLPPKDQQHQIAELLLALEDNLNSLSSLLDVHSKLVESFRMEVFAKNIWPSGKLKNIFDVQLGKMLSAKAKKGEAPFPYLTNQNIQWGRIDLGKLNEMDFNEKEKGKFSLRPGDLLVCEGGEVGRTAIWRGEVEDCYYQKALHRLRAKKNYLPEIMLQFMFWANSQGVFKGLTGHSTIAHLTAVKLKEMEVPDIPIEVQRKIKEKFDEIEVPKSKIEFQFKQSLGLRKSLINQVF